ncbi:hypothetical protein BCR36DRAFT_365587 [Piromyces finnis]|uniref:PH-domain-containing protein n=1 Tax=Piromyces finnis TaxID=1754191 RepID=A0A1Y1VPC4_9FUNG|nr:hypothetical protein BCR36DRAFT_365587 [Piromyces finnis]|eukprot:ORX61002.1 hypothetical protein BCR36DRAFT_365587 [Piromyces finnis]
MFFKDKEIVFGQYQFDAEEEDEIGFKVGEPIIIVEKDEKYNDGWWKGMKFNGTIGIFPSNYVIDKNIKNVDVEKLLNYREKSLNKTTIKLKSPKQSSKSPKQLSVEPSNSPDSLKSPQSYKSSKSTKSNISQVSPKSPTTKVSSPKSPKSPITKSLSPKSPKSPITKASPSPKSPKKSPTTLTIEMTDTIDKNFKKGKSSKNESFVYNEEKSESPKSPKKLSNQKSPSKVVMSFYTGQESCHGSIIRLSSADDHELSDSMILPLPQENNGDDSLIINRKDSKKSKNGCNISINTNPIVFNSSNVPKSPYLMRTPRSATKSPYLSSPKHNSYTPQSATAKSPYIQMKSCLKHKSTSVPSSPIKKYDNSVPMINTINIKPNIATMEIENLSGISGASSLFSPNRTTRYMDDFMLDDNDPENPKNWNVDEVADWLYKIGYVSASSFFREKKVDGKMLVQMNLPTLREIGVSTLSERITLLHSILSLKEEYSSKCFEEMLYSGNVTSETLASPVKQSTIDGNYYQMEMNNMYEKALKNPNIDDEKKKKLKKMMSTFTVSDYLTESPNRDQEYMQLQNQLLKKQQLQNKQNGRGQLTMNQYNNAYNESPKQYYMSDQYGRNIPMINNNSNQAITHNNMMMMQNSKNFVKGNNNMYKIETNVSPLMNEHSANEYSQNSTIVNPLYIMNNSSNYCNDINQGQNRNNENKKEEKERRNSGRHLSFSEPEKTYIHETISPKVKDKKHKYLNQYHDFNLATRQGWLNVKYGTFKIWKKRWAILVYDTLYLLKDQYINNEKPPRIVLVLQITPNNKIDSDKQDSKKFNFKVKDPKLGTIHFATDSQLSMITWVNLFVRIIMSNPIKQIQLYPLKDQKFSNNYFMANSNVNNVEIGDHFLINRKERYQDVQKKEYKPEGEINNSFNDRTINRYNNEDASNYDMQTLKEVNALQEQFNNMKCDIYSMSTIGSNSNYSSPVNNNNNTILNPTIKQTQMVQQQLQQQYKYLLQQQQQHQQLQQQQQQHHHYQMKKRSNDLTIDTHFNNNYDTVRKGKHDNNVMFNIGDRNDRHGLTLDTNILSGEQTLLSGETTSARNTIVNRNDMYISPGNMSYISNGISTGSTSNSNKMNNTTNNYAPAMNYNARMSLYTPVSNADETSPYYDSSSYQESNNYKYTTQENRLSDLTMDPYTELRKYNYLSNIPRSAESINENLVESFSKNNYLSNLPTPNNVNTYT